MDQNFFLWCLLAHRMNVTIHSERVSQYEPYENNINMDNVTYPVPINKVALLEKINNMRINVFGYEDKEVFTLHIPKRTDQECCNLLLISEGGKSHYCLIKNMSGLVNDCSKDTHACFICYHCLHRFSRADLLEKHTPYCEEHSMQHVKMPKEEDRILKFIHQNYQHPTPNCIYADFEALIVPMDTAKPSNYGSYIEKVSKHIPCGYAFVVIEPDGQSIKPLVIYRGNDAVDHFLKNKENHNF